MKCHRHETVEAIGVCAQCGRALCRECAPPPPAPLACSAGCAEKFSAERTAIRQLLARSEQNARASAAYYFLSATLSGGAAVAAWFWLPSPFLIAFAGGGALVLLVAALWHTRAARKNISPPEN